MSRLLFTILRASIVVCAASCSRGDSPEPTAKDREVAASQPCSLRAAFIGDSGTGPDARRVLELIVRENADIIVHQGDLGYGAPKDWVAMVSELAAGVPYVASTGNHDHQPVVVGDAAIDPWREFYKPFLLEQIRKTPDLQCDFSERDTRMGCRFRNVFIALTDMHQGVDPESEQQRISAERFLAAQLERDRSDWQVCSWHAPSTEMSLIKGPGAQTRASAYAACARSGAMVATAHFHSYSRTKSLTSFSPPLAVGSAKRVRVGPGVAFAFVSGLGGNGIDEVTCDPSRESCPLWASSFDDDHGALFIDFGCDDNRRVGRGRFVTVGGAVVDEFEIESSR